MAIRKTHGKKKKGGKPDKRRKALRTVKGFKEKGAYLVSVNGHIHRVDTQYACEIKIK